MILIARAYTQTRARAHTHARVGKYKYTYTIWGGGGEKKGLRVLSPVCQYNKLLATDGLHRRVRFDFKLILKCDQ